jgi:hypothetical protein
VLERDLVDVLERAELDRLHRREPEQQQHRIFQPLVDHHVAVDDLGHPSRTGVEELDRLVHDVARLVFGHHRAEVVAGLPEGVDLGFEVGHGVLRSGTRE